MSRVWLAMPRLSLRHERLRCASRREVNAFLDLLQIDDDAGMPELHCMAMPASRHMARYVVSEVAIGPVGDRVCHERILTGRDGGAHRTAPIACIPEC